MLRNLKLFDTLKRKLTKYIENKENDPFEIIISDYCNINDQEEYKIACKYILEIINEVSISLKKILKEIIIENKYNFSLENNKNFLFLFHIYGLKKIKFKKSFLNILLYYNLKEKPNIKSNNKFMTNKEKNIDIIYKNKNYLNNINYGINFKYFE